MAYSVVPADNCKQHSQHKQHQDLLCMTSAQVAQAQVAQNHIHCVELPCQSITYSVESASETLRNAWLPSVQPGGILDLWNGARLSKLGRCSVNTLILIPAPIYCAVYNALLRTFPCLVWVHALRHQLVERCQVAQCSTPVRT